MVIINIGIGCGFWENLIIIDYLIVLYLYLFFDFYFDFFLEVDLINIIILYMNFLKLFFKYVCINYLVVFNLFIINICIFIEYCNVLMFNWDWLCGDFLMINWNMSLIESMDYMEWIDWCYIFKYEIEKFFIYLWIVNVFLFIYIYLLIIEERFRKIVKIECFFWLFKWVIRLVIIVEIKI